jgi:hypothetical protein
MSNLAKKPRDESPGRIYQQMNNLLFFCPKRVAFNAVSGIITTNLGNTATRRQGRRARKDGYITPKYAPLHNRRGAFFLAILIRGEFRLIVFIINYLTFIRVVPMIFF